MKKFLFCPYCSRILFYTDNEENSILAFDDSDIGGFTGFDDEVDDVEEEVVADIKAIASDDYDDSAEVFSAPEIFDNDGFDSEDEFDEEDDLKAKTKKKILMMIQWKKVLML